jgi:sugar transferase (PEP-CTERM/EpsH1 system associated)
MRTLVLYPYVPFPLDRGAFHRAFHLLRELSRVNEVDLLALAEGGAGLEHRGVFQAFCRRVEIISFRHPNWQKLVPGRLLNPLPATIAHWALPEVASAIDCLLARERYDAIHVCDIVMAQYLRGARRTAVVGIDRTRVDLQYQWLEYRRRAGSWRARVLHWENWLKLWAYEKTIARRAEVEIVCGPDDAAFVRRFVSRRAPIAIIPNGVDPEYFHPDAAPDPRERMPTLLFCGAMDYSPNRDALEWYFSEMHALVRNAIPELRVLIVGKEPGATVKSYGALPGVTVTGTVPDVRPYYRRAWAQMVPIRIGGGTRLKIVESLAMGTPVVSTSIGAQGLDLQNDVDVLLADESGEFARRLIGLLNSEMRRAEMAGRGLLTVRERFSWRRLGQELCNTYRTCTIGRSNFRL